MIQNSENPTISVTADAVSSRKPDVAYVSYMSERKASCSKTPSVKPRARARKSSTRSADTCRADLKEVQLKDIHAGESKPALGIGRDRSNGFRPEVVKGILVVLAPKPDLAVRTVDMACRMGCLMANPSGVLARGLVPRSHPLWTCRSWEVEHEATALAIAEARKRALEIAKRMEKRLGPVRSINAMVFHTPEDFMRRNRTPLLSRGSYYPCPLNKLKSQRRSPCRLSCWIDASPYALGAHLVAFLN